MRVSDGPWPKRCPRRSSSPPMLLGWAESWCGGFTQHSVIRSTRERQRPVPAWKRSPRGKAATRPGTATDYGCYESKQSGDGIPVILAQIGKGSGIALRCLIQKAPTRFRKRSLPQLTSHDFERGAASFDSELTVTLHKSGQKTQTSSKKPPPDLSDGGFLECSIY
ncbi:MAG: hypothetical protein ACI8UZ_003243 [Akkermansiaceae bacterium]|jgi:hypothetical protein